MGVLECYQPANVLRFFEEICSIPHGSFHVDEISDYLVKYAVDRHLAYQQDADKNVIIWQDGTEGYEDAEPVIIQGHMDMVAVKDADVEKDMEKEGLDLVVEGDFLSAKGTTLGGDDGIALAYALAIMDDATIPHPPIEAVFTVNEEVGLLGASSIDVSNIKGKMLLNVDSEAEGIFTVSCAGGIRVDCHFPVQRTAMDGVEIGIKIDQLRGGHSGAEIHKGRINANVAVLRMLLTLSAEMEYHLVSLKGGDKYNAIAVSGEACILVSEEQRERAVELLCMAAEELAYEYETVDPDVEFEVSDVYKYNVNVIPVEESRRLVTVMANMPYGVQRMNPDIEGMVQTSLNLGIMNSEEEEIHLGYTVRSSVESEKYYIVRKLISLTELVGGHVDTRGDYPGWEYKPESKIRDILVDVFRDLYGSDPVVEGIHAGLECGLLAKKIENLDAISIGPQMYDIHTTAERISLSSIERTWNLIITALSKMR